MSIRIALKLQTILIVNFVMTVIFFGIVKKEQTFDSEFKFNKQLASWAVQCKIPQCHVDNLLTLLKSSNDFDHTHLPNKFLILINVSQLDFLQEKFFLFFKGKNLFTFKD